MKKITLLAALLAFGFSQTSCNKDDDKNELPAATLLGKWNYSKDGMIAGGTEVLVDYDGNEPGCTKDYVLFNANNSFLDVDYGTDCEEFSDAGTYAVTGNSIVVDFGEGAETVEIMNLSYTELKLKTADGFITVFNR